MGMAEYEYESDAARAMRIRTSVAGDVRRLHASGIENPEMVALARSEITRIDQCGSGGNQPSRRRLHTAGMEFFVFLHRIAPVAGPYWA